MGLLLLRNSREEPLDLFDYYLAMFGYWSEFEVHELVYIYVDFFLGLTVFRERKNISSLDSSALTILNNAIQYYITLNNEKYIMKHYAMKLHIILQNIVQNITV